MNIKEIYGIIEELNVNNSSSDKLNVLKKYKENQDFKDILYYTYNTLECQFNVTKKTLFNEVVNCHRHYDDLINLLGDLVDRKISGHEAISCIQNFIIDNEECNDIIKCILDRDLGCGIATTMINKAIPNLIPTFKVVLANSYDKLKKKPNFENEEYLSSRKLDGCRCICIKQGDNIEFKSRTGKVFSTLGKLVEQIKQIPFDCVLDGEICILKENGDEDFKSIMKEIKKKEHTIEKPCYKVFDLLTIEAFYDKIESRKLSERLILLYKTFTATEGYFSTYVKAIKQISVKNQEHFEKLRQGASKRGWEGIMLRKDTSYENGRTNNLLKVKNFLDAEFVVTAIEKTTKKMLVNGVMKETLCMGSIIIDFDGNEVGVGSGWSDKQRIFYYSNPNEIIGKTVTIQYFEVTHNDKGEKSLRFPTIKHIYEEVRDV